VRAVSVPFFGGGVAVEDQGKGWSAGEGRGGGGTFHLFSSHYVTGDLLCFKGSDIYSVHTAWGGRLTDPPLNPLGLPRGSSWSASGLTYE